MIYQLEFSEQFKRDIERHIKSGNKKLVAKIEQIIPELAQTPRSGIGKPEQLKGFNQETWSRRIDSKHRIVYEIYDEVLSVYTISAYGHYDDK
ncbi:MAG: Txe/YoeB family addiction module toxin [Rikenellaceae bacterium]